MSSLKKVFSVLLTAALAVLHSSLDVASLFVNEEAKTEANALLNWKASLQNETQSHLPSWTLQPNNATNSSSNQNKSSIPCSWYGISCNQAGSVIGLNLANSRLKGNISNLVELDLHRNQLSGSIPPEIGNLSNLVIFDISNNNLIGLIPSTIGNIKKLTFLQMYKNNLSGSIPQEIGNLKSLVNLSLHTNNLSDSIPTSLGALSNLTVLHMYNNQLSGTIPEELGNLKSITDLELGKNKLTGTVPNSLDTGEAIKAGDPRLAHIDVSMPGFLAQRDLPPIELPLQRSSREVAILREETASSCLSLEAKIDQFHLKEEGKAPKRSVELSDSEAEFDRLSAAHSPRLVDTRVDTSSEEEEEMALNPRRGLKDLVARRNKG
ncbi:probable leucine-rich repeat receptor-like protein kinase At1g35710 [Quercus suber]|uniref:probable leucine-rich repeat receptor-like protein kinase At1g35710 n=1 Tax=Quercus suber TaxID=58331 RepID=UPI0032DEB5F7